MTRSKSLSKPSSTSKRKPTKMTRAVKGLAKRVDQLELELKHTRTLESVQKSFERAEVSILEDDGSEDVIPADQGVLARKNFRWSALTTMLLILSYTVSESLDDVAENFRNALNALSTRNKDVITNVDISEDAIRSRLYNITLLQTKRAGANIWTDHEDALLHYMIGCGKGSVEFIATYNHLKREFGRSKSGIEARVRNITAFNEANSLYRVMLRMYGTPRQTYNSLSGISIAALDELVRNHKTIDTVRFSK